MHPGVFSLALLTEPHRTRETPRLRFDFLQADVRAENQILVDVLIALLL